MGHRIPGHAKDEHLHGHRFKLRVEVEGPVEPRSGFVVDFSAIKALVNERVVDILDHAFMYAADDIVMEDFFAQNASMRRVRVEGVPTCETILQWIHDRVDPPLSAAGLRLASLTLWESETSCATLEKGVEAK
jgi:6-pyruvoyltetrahydropterin/6-carboxytetrahydropterin synthase